MLLLITVSWISLLAVLAAISAIILPLVSGVEARLLASVLRLLLSLALFATWLAWIFELTRYSLIRLSREAGKGEQR
jgi:predicted ABC-type exoprotein transport system permease subunit